MTVSTSLAGLALLGGLLTILSPCILPILPILLGQSLRSNRYGPAALVTGLIVGFAAMGALLGITASWLTGLANILRNVAITLATHCRDSSNFSEMELSSLQRVF
ncbi:MAG: hypothetical protein BRC48_02435 [Cyanobacteria bacterium QS_9_48_30]|nr:MAG: hypothetical protein BRC48_02435 [Cyanobacteria bacterium QS_9_48_30]